MPKGTTADQLNKLQQKYDKQKQNYELLYGKYLVLLDDFCRLTAKFPGGTEKAIEALKNDN